MYPLIKFVHFFSFAVLLGGPAFYYLIWRPSMRQADDTHMRRLVAIGAYTGGLLFIASGAADVVRAYWAILGRFDWDFLSLFFTSTTFGRITLVKIALAAVFTAVAARAPNHVVGRAFLTATGTATAATISLASHAASSGHAAVTADVVHLLATAAWGGGLIYFAFLPWRSLLTARQGHRAGVARMIHRYSNLGITAITLLGLTGMYASTLHVYGVPALTNTSYGQALVAKLAMIGVIIAIAAVNHFYFQPLTKKFASEEQILRQRPQSRLTSRALTPGPKGQRTLRATTSARDESALMRLGTFIRLEAVAVVFVLAATGLLTTQAPPNEPVVVTSPFVAQDPLGPWDMVVRITSDTEGYTLFNVDLFDEGTPAQDVDLTLRLNMVGHDMSPQVLGAQMTQPGSFHARTVLSMSGMWLAEIEATGPASKSTTQSDTGSGSEPAPISSTGPTEPARPATDLDTQTAPAHGFTAISFPTEAGTENHDRVMIFYLPALTMRPGAIQQLIALGLFAVVGTSLLLIGFREEGRRWVIPFGSWVLAFAIYSSVPLITVEGYPTTFTSNPIAATAESIGRGKALFETHCAICHGMEGRGDGPRVFELPTPPADLSGPKVHTHPDGDLFWWISKGIPKAGMPSFEDTISEEDRWHIINFVRLLGVNSPSGDLEPHSSER